MSATRLQGRPDFVPLCICWQLWALPALSNKLDSGYFPNCLLRKVAAHPRAFCSRPWLMGILLRIIVLEKDAFPASVGASVLLHVLCERPTGRLSIRVCVHFCRGLVPKVVKGHLGIISSAPWESFFLTAYYYLLYFIRGCKCRWCWEDQTVDCWVLQSSQCLSWLWLGDARHENCCILSQFSDCRDVCGETFSGNRELINFTIE